MSAHAEPDPPPKKLGLTKVTEHVRVNEEEATVEASTEHDPMELLRVNRAHETKNNSVYDQSPAAVKKKSRRLRDYVIILIVGNVLLGILLSTNFVFFVAGLTFFSAGLTWVMLVCLEDY